MRAEKDKISIIIPVYDVEPYIRRCLDSVSAQTYQNLEILLIDDGSTDGGGVICDAYAERDERIRVFHQSNGGLSSALNAGLNSFTGDYLGFADPDDWIEPDMFGTLYRAAKAEKAPISVSGYYKDTDAESLPIANRERIPEGVIPVHEMLLYPLKRDDYLGFCGYVWNKLYQADAIKNSKISFDHGIRYGMDVLFYTTLVLTEKCTGVYIEKPLYHYYQRNTGISKSESVEIKMDILSAYKKIEEAFKKNGYADLCFWARGFYCYHAGAIAKIAIKNSDAVTLLRMQGEIRAHFDDYVKTNEAYPEKVAGMRNLLKVKITR